MDTHSIYSHMVIGDLQLTAQILKSIFEEVMKRNGLFINKQSRLNVMFKRLLMVEARGIEPLSENLFIQLSPSAAYRLHSLIPAPTGRLRYLVSLIHPMRRGTRTRRSPLK